MSRQNQRMIEEALAALHGDAEPPPASPPSARPAAGPGRPGPGPEPEPEPEPEPVEADSALAGWLSAALADVLGVGSEPEDAEQMLPVATYMLSFESDDDLFEYMEQIMEEAAEEEDREWLFSSLGVQRGRLESGRGLATAEELDALWEGGDEAAVRMCG